MAQVKFDYDVEGQEVPLDDEGDPIYPHFCIDEDSWKLFCHKYWNAGEGKYEILNGPRRAGDLRTDAENGVGQGDHICAFSVGDPIRRLLKRTPPPAP